MNMVKNGKFIHLQANLVVNCDLHFLLIIIEVRFKAQRSCTNIRKGSVSLLIEVHYSFDTQNGHR